MRRNTKESLIAELCNRGLTKQQAYNELSPLVRTQTRPMVFSANVGGHREPKSMAEQLQELQYAIGRIYNKLGRSTSSDFNSEEIELSETETSEIEEDGIEEDETEEEEEDEEKKPRKNVRAVAESELEKFKRRIRELRKFCVDRATMSEPVDSISMRPAEAAARLIPHGIPTDALLDSCTMHWPKDVRRDAGVEDFDFISLSQKIMRDREIENGEFHKLFGYALLLAEKRQPVMLVGPFGTGKSFLAKQVAEYIFGEGGYGETPMTPGATRGDLLGRNTLGGVWNVAATENGFQATGNGFMSAEFVERYSNGGVFNFEEIDASDPSMLIVLNNALASDHLYNSANGEVYEKSSDFCPFSTANTFGLGANREFTGRERLDAATIDRWRMGRIYVELDETVEDRILNSATV